MKGLRLTEEQLFAYESGKRGAARIVSPERDELKACLEYLELHPAVAFAYRVNTGAMQVDGRWVKFGPRGQPDICGMLKGGRALYFECKRVGGKPSVEQWGFLKAVKDAGGLAGWGGLKQLQEMIDKL